MVRPHRMCHGGRVNEQTTDAGRVQDLRLRPPRHRVDPHARWYWLARAAPGWAVVAAAQVIALTLGWQVLTDWGTVTLPVTALLAAAHLIVMPQWRYRVHRWEATDEAVYTQAGWFNQERRIAPISRIQTVDTTRGPIQQLFGLSNVTITTASAAGPLAIDGLARETAQRLADDLTEQTQSQRGDAT